MLRRVRSRRTAWLTARLRELDPEELAAIDAATEPLRKLLPRGRAPVTAAIARFNRRTFSSLRYRNYRLFFSGQLVSQTGSWMQRIALGWYILQLTHNDAFAVGIMAFAQFLPYSIFGLFAGVFTDRLDARRLVIATQVLQTVFAAVLTWIALDGIARPWMLYAIAFVNGTVLVLDVPSRQQLTYRMVGRDDPAERDRAQLEPLQRVAHLRAVDGRRHARVRRRRRVLPRQRHQLLRRPGQPARDADAGLLPASSNSSGRRSSRGRARASPTSGGSRACSPSSG